MSEFEVANALDSMKDTVSIFEPIYSDGGDTIYLSETHTLTHTHARVPHTQLQ